MNKTSPVLLSLLALALTVVGCASKPKNPHQHMNAYHQALQQSPPALAKGSVAEKAAIQRFQDFLSEMTVEKIQSQTRTVYAEDAFLNDTLKTLHGAAEIEHYFLETMKNAESVTVKFDDVAESGGNYYFRWVMDVRLRKYKKGETIRTIGVTHVRFNEKGLVTVHQDYWDSSAGLFEHLPVVGGMIRWIKNRL